MPRAALDLTGKRCGRLLVEKRIANNVHGGARWRCLCDCGKRTNVIASSLRSGNTKSCGCGREEARITHGYSYKPVYRSWLSMHIRCEDESYSRYPDYGGRGIKVCKRWSKFENFLADMGDRPKGKTLDRINNDKNYSPGNCKWSTPKQQANNRRPRRPRS